MEIRMEGRAEVSDCLRVGGLAVEEDCGCTAVDGL
jgi:hypothetical protein